MNFEKIKKQFMAKPGFMKWGRLSQEAIEQVQLYGENWKEVWISTDVHSLWIAFDDGHGTGYNKIDYDDMESLESPLEMIQLGLEESYDYNEGATGKILELIEGYGYEPGGEVTIKLANLKSWRMLGA